MGMGSKKNTLLKVIIALVVIAWSFVTLNAGFYVDENGLLTIYKGIYQGQHMFTDSWEALQTGGILSYPLLALYYKVLSPLFDANGLNIGMVFFMRICYMIVRLLVALYLFLTLKRTDYERGAFASALLYYMFVVGWRNFSYKSYCDLAVMLIICFLIRYHLSHKTRYFVWTAIATCVAILAYPTMIIFALFMVVAILVAIYRNEISIRQFLAYIIPCVIIGGAVVLYLQFTSGLGNVLAQISNLGDQDYEHGVLYRLGVMLLSYLVFAVIAYIPIAFIVLFRKFRYVSDYVETAVLSAYWLIFFIAVCVVRIDSVSTSRFIYAILILFFWFPYFAYERKEKGLTRIGAYKNSNSDDKTLLWIIFIISVVTQLIWSISTNQDVTVPGHMAIFVVIADIIILLNEKEGYEALVGFISVVAAFFMGFWVPEHNGGYSDIMQERYIVEEGTLKGIALLPEDYQANEICYKLVTENVNAEDNLLVAFGSNCTGYLNSDAWQGTYSVYARTQLNTKLLDYYELNPDNQADYVLVDMENPKFATFKKGETGKYLLKTYTKRVAQDGSYVLFGR